MTRVILFFLIVVVIAVIALSVMNTMSVSSNNQANLERERTSQVIAQEKTKQEAALLRTEETTRVVNNLTLVIGPLLAFGVLAIIILLADAKITRNRIYEMQQLAIIERNRIRELKQLEIIQNKQLEQKYRFLLQDDKLHNNNIVVYDMEDYNTIDQYETGNK